VCGCSGWVCIMSAMLFDVFFIEMINMLEKSTDEVSNALRSTPACCGCCSVETHMPCKVGQCERHCAAVLRESRQHATVLGEEPLTALLRTWTAHISFSQRSCELAVRVL
jgi:hypothetical protein